MMEMAGHYTGAQRATMQEQAGKFPQRWCDELDRFEAVERRMAGGR